MHEEVFQHVTFARPVGGYRLLLRFEDGFEGEVDLRPVIGAFTEVFAPFADPAYVARVFVDREAGTICWPNGANVDPVVLYCATKGIPVPNFERGEKQKRR